MIRASTRFDTGILGERLRLVGSVSQGAKLLALTPQGTRECDIIELRLDLLGTVNILPLAQPVIATIRLANEGGGWSDSDEARFPLFDAALRQCAAVDIEFRSPLLPAVSALAVRYQKALIVSYHDFEKTPSLAELRQVMDRASSYGTVVKIATLATTADDVQTLRELFRQNCSAALCVLGMGAYAGQTRVEFPRLGSCLTYGYLDVPLAPGQPSVAELRQLLRGSSVPL
jgi:3-dehydroquinate dehydratase-1